MLIENRDLTMTEAVGTAMDYSTRIDIAVGYFFISGFELVLDNIKKVVAKGAPNPKIRIITSPHTDRPTMDALKAAGESDEYVARQAIDRRAVEEELESARESLASQVGHMGQTPVEHAAISELRSMIEDGSLEIRVYTREQLHAKLYMFVRDIHPGQELIIGSSNFSAAGFRSHAELNLSTHDVNLFEKCVPWFEGLWDDPLTVEFTKDVAEILGSSWAGRARTPAEVARKIAITENPETAGVETGELKLYKFQEQAVRAALEKIGDYGGVMISDVVGAGKTYVGTGIIRGLLELDCNYPLIICPARLVNMWEDIKNEYGLPAKVLSSSRLKELDEYGYCDVVLVDESHMFKNDRTERHKRLLEFMDGRASYTRMIMLTATPISNSVMNIKNQLALFSPEMMEKIPVIESEIGTKSRSGLDAYFEGVEDDDNQLTDSGREKIRELLRYILIRRTRRMILEECDTDENGRKFMEKDGRPQYFPGRTLKTMGYDIEKTYEGRYGEIESILEGLLMSRYMPGRYVREPYRGVEPYSDITRLLSLGGIVKVSLLKRLESSISAFDRSVRRYIDGHEAFLRQLDEGRVPVGKEFSKAMAKALYNGEKEDMLQEELDRELGMIESDYASEAFYIENWIADIRADLDRFIRIRSLLQGARFEDRDDKLHVLLRCVNKRPEKTLIFTESADTARYIHGYLRDRVGGRTIRQIDSGNKTDRIQDAVERFAPKFNHKDYPEEEQVDIIISTDILSEGLNLQSCGFLINYDFHWNPVRLIQRNGRIDRLGSDHEEITIINFLTTPDVEKSLNLMARVKRRIETIKKLVGNEGNLLEENEPADPDDVCDIYNRRMPAAHELIDSLAGGSMEGSDRLAREVRRDERELQEYLRLPAGLRAIAGRSSLLVACSAESSVSGQGAQFRGTDYKRYYEVTKDGVRQIRQSTFLKRVMESSGDPALPEPPEYDEMVSAAWDEFNRDISASTRRVPKYRYQRELERMIRKLPARVDQDLPEQARQEIKQRVLDARKFLSQRMVQQKRPYQDLKRLHMRSSKMEPMELLEALEALSERHRGSTVRLEIRRPQILYSMMVGR